MTNRTVHFTLDGVRTGLRLATPMGMSVGVYGVVFGVLARQVEMSMLESMTMNVVVFAGAAQMAAMDSWRYPLPIAAILITTLLVNMRLVMLSASLRPWMRDLPAKIVYPTMHILSDEAWAVAMQAHRKGHRDAGIVLGCNLAILFAWLPTVAIGHLVGSQIGDPERLGLDFAFAAVFGSMLFGGYRSRFDLVPWGVSAVVALIVWKLVPGTWYVIAGGLSGLGAAMALAPVPESEAERDVDGAMP